MNFLKLFFRENKLALILFAATLALYGAMFVGSRLNQVSGESAQPLSKVQRMTREEIRSREETFQKRILDNPKLASLIGSGIFGVLLVGLTLNVFFALKSMRGETLWGTSGAVPRAPAWGVPDILLVVIFLFFLEGLIYFVQGVLLYLMGWHPPKDILVMVNSLARNVIAAFFVLWLVKKKYNHSPADLGLQTRSLFKDMLTGWIAYLALIPILFMCLLAIMLVAKFFAYEPEPQAVVEMYLRQSGQGVLIFFTFFVAVLGPFFEEIFFRGFMYKGFAEKIGKTKALWLSAFIFAALHVHLAAFFPILLLGVFLTVLYEKTGSLVPSITLHVTHNLMMVIFTLCFKALSS